MDKFLLEEKWRGSSSFLGINPTTISWAYVVIYEMKPDKGGSLPKNHGHRTWKTKIKTSFRGSKQSNFFDLVLLLLLPTSLPSSTTALPTTRERKGGHLSIKYVFFYLKKSLHVDFFSYCLFFKRLWSVQIKKRKCRRIFWVMMQFFTCWPIKKKPSTCWANDEWLEWKNEC